MIFLLALIGGSFSSAISDAALGGPFDLVKRVSKVGYGGL